MRLAMLRGTGALLCLAFASWTAGVQAQEYPPPRPVPRATDAATLRAYAVRREVLERFRLGLKALDTGDWSAAAAEFERIGALHPPQPQASTAQYDLAIAYAKLNRYRDAARELRLAIAADPGFLAAMANLVAVDLALGDLRGARAAADRFVALAPDSARALYSRGIVALQGNDAKTARQDFGKLTSFNPAYAVAHYDLGLAETKLADYPSAQREFSLALQLAPGYARARIALGAIFLRQGKRTKARAEFAQAAGETSDPALRTVALAMRDAIR